ncbi:MAG TPA: acetylxylan esterase [Terriglobia bacterium]|nr:acetylxylan esterase [Terriglobia bacterium]
MRVPFLVSSLILLAISGSLYGQSSADPFRVLRQTPIQGPRVTAYLRFQAELAWEQDELRRSVFKSIEGEEDLLRVQQTLRSKLVRMLGGMPETKTPLNPRITGQIEGKGFRVEKVIFESLPGFHVTALLYLPQNSNSNTRHPAILVACGHSPKGKAYYQTLCLRLVKRGYVVLCWDPIGQGERSQFWETGQGGSRYNLVCGEHAIMGNLAYLAGANLARWEIWDGIRAIDYLLTRPEVDTGRINITGTSGGGFQAAHIAALDARIRVAAPSCYISALPMRMSNRIFEDPDSDPEQDLYGMVSEGVDHPALLLLMYPRPVIVCAAVKDFFPVEGTRKTYREVAALYEHMGKGERIAITEGFHRHQFSDQNQDAAFQFLDRFNGMPPHRGLDPIEPIDEKLLQCTRSGQVRVDFPEGQSLIDLVRQYYNDSKHGSPQTLKRAYYGDGYPGIGNWPVVSFDDKLPSKAIAAESMGRMQLDGISIDKYLLHHSRGLTIPLLHIRRLVGDSPHVLLWFTLRGKATQDDWPRILQLVEQGYQVLTWDFRGLGEDRMFYKASSPDDPGLVSGDWQEAYANSLSSVLANYVYNSLLTGRPYFLQMMEDTEIVVRFATESLKLSGFSALGVDEAGLLASSIAEVIPGVALAQGQVDSGMTWSTLVTSGREVWPIQYLLPGGAYIH